MTSIRFDTTQVSGLGRRARLSVNRAMVGEGKRIIRRFIREHARERLRGGSGLRRRTGALARSITFIATGDTVNNFRAIAFSAGNPYAAYHEHGGVIRPKRPNGFLTIPLSFVKTAAGVPRYTAREIISNPGLGGSNSTFFRHSRAGNLILFGAKPTGQEGVDVLTPLFVLKKSVRNDNPKLKFAETWQRRRIATAIELREAFARGLARVGA